MCSPHDALGDETCSKLLAAQKFKSCHNELSRTIYTGLLYWCCAEIFPNYAVFVQRGL